MAKYAIGVDYGTLSGRAVLVNVQTGEEIAYSVLDYPHAVMAVSYTHLRGWNFTLSQPRTNPNQAITGVPLQPALPGGCKKADVYKRQDLFMGTKSDHQALPVGVVLTIPAAGSETSYSVVITKEDGLIKKGLSDNRVRPQFAILNPELTYTLPFYQTACGVSDMLAHVMERFFTQTSYTDVSDRICEGVMRSILNLAPRLKENPNDYELRANIMWAGTLAHNGILGMGREEDWGSHGIEHELSAIYDIAHGAGLSIVFPAWMKYCLLYTSTVIISPMLQESRKWTAFFIFA